MTTQDVHVAADTTIEEKREHSFKSIPGSD